MTTYLVYLVVYNCVLKELLVKRDIDISQDLIQFWYPFQWKHKTPFHIYHIHDAFLVRYRSILTGIVPDRATQEAKDFLKGNLVRYILMKNTHTLDSSVFKEHLFLYLSLWLSDFSYWSYVDTYVYSSCFFENRYK